MHQSPGPSYAFTDEWRVPAPVRTVYDLLEDVGSYPDWWPQVRAVIQVGPDTALVACRSVLPYTLHFEMTALRRDPEAGVLEAGLDGDLVGSCRWELSADSDGTRVMFRQEVTTPSRLLRVAERFARPLLELNHHLMMRGGRRGLVARTRP